MISNQYFACNLVSSPIGSLLTKLRQMGKKCYCCKKDVVAAKIHNLMLKLTFFVLGKEKATSNKTEKHCQSFSITLMTPSDKIVVSDLRSHELFYDELIKLFINTLAYP